MKHKLIAVALSLLMLLGLCACGQVTPEQQLETQLKSYQTDATQLKDEFLKEVDTEQINDEATDQLLQFFFQLPPHMTWKMGTSTVEGETATIPVTITNKNTTPVLTECVGAAMESAFTQAFAAAFGGEELSEEDADKIITQAMNETLSKYTVDQLEDFSADITVTMNKTEDGWALAEENNELFLVLLGLNPSELQSFSDQLSGLTESIQE